MPITPDAVDMADFAHARGAPPAARAVLRQQATDFQVVEHCPVTPGGEGEHLWLLVEKIGMTTAKVADCLADAAHIKSREIGFSGLKDRWAVTRQWYSLPWPIRLGDARPLVVDELQQIDAGGSFRILEQQRHDRKLRRSTHNTNGFVITLRDVAGEPAARDAIDADLTRIAASGVPNYFGAQRFGHGGRNLAMARALFQGKRLRRNQRGFALSAARSFLFNRVLDARIRAGTWNHVLPGEAVMLAGSNSVFGAAGEDMHALEQRMAAFDIHPSGPLPGRSGRVPLADEALMFENDVLAEHAALVDGLAHAGVDAARRSLRLDTRDLTWRWADATTLVVEMTLPSGSFATSVLREFVTISEAEQTAVSVPAPVSSSYPWRTGRETENSSAHHWRGAP